MAFSWRFSVTMEDRSQKAIVSNAAGVAGTVVAGARSLEKPVYFERGESQRMLNLLGAPTKVEQGILEAVEYNKSYPIWVVSPAKVLKRSYVAACKTDGVNAITFVNMDKDYMLSEIAADGSFTAGVDFDATGSASVYKENLVDESPTTMSIYLESDPTLQFTVQAEQFEGGGIAGTIASTDNAYTFSISSGTIDDGDCLHIEFTKKIDNAVLYLINRAVGQQVSMVFISKELTSNSGYIASEISIKNYLNKTVKVSTANFAFEKGAKDGFGNPLNAETVFERNDYIEAVYNPAYDNDLADSRYFTGSTSLDFMVITRNDGVAGTDFAAGYAWFKKFNSYPVDLFFDATGEKSVPSLLAEIRGGDVPQYTGFQPFASVLLPLFDLETGSPINKYEDAIEAIKGYPANRGFSVYQGNFKIRNDYSSKAPVFEGVPMGEIAKRTADSIVLSYGGLATAWIDEAGVGGLLSGGRILGYAKLQEEYSETKLKALDEAKINPVVYDYTYGPMIASRRTTYTDYSDYSFNDYSRIIDYCIKNIIKNVFPYQVVKMNDDDHRAIVRMRTNAILEPLTVRPYAVLRNYAIKCDAENNSDEVLAQEQFILEVAIQVTPKSRTLKLVFINAPQTQSVEAMFED